MRGARTYHKSHSLKRIVLRWNWPIVPPIPVAFGPAKFPLPHGMLPGLALGLGVPVPPPPVQLTLICARSKCVPTKIEPGVVDEPVKNPFGLHIYRSSP